MDKGVWTVPAERMKMNRDHRIALSAAAQTLLTQMGVKDEGLIFPAPRGAPLASPPTRRIIKPTT